MTIINPSRKEPLRASHLCVPSVSVYPEVFLVCADRKSSGRVRVRVRVRVCACVCFLTLAWAFRAAGFEMWLVCFQEDLCLS